MTSLPTSDAADRPQPPPALPVKPPRGHLRRWRSSRCHRIVCVAPPCIWPLGGLTKGKELARHYTSNALGGQAILPGRTGEIACPPEARVSPDDQLSRLFHVRLSSFRAAPVHAGCTVSLHFERRRFPRVHLQDPLPAASGALPVFVLDLSVGGLRLTHQGSLGRPGDTCAVRFHWEGAEVELTCRIMNTEVLRIGRASFAGRVHQSGVAITGASPELSARSLAHRRPQRVSVGVGRIWCERGDSNPHNSEVTGF